MHGHVWVRMALHILWHLKAEICKILLLIFFSHQLTSNISLFQLGTVLLLLLPTQDSQLKVAIQSMKIPYVETAIPLLSV